MGVKGKGKLDELFWCKVIKELLLGNFAGNRFKIFDVHLHIFKGKDIEFEIVKVFGRLLGPANENRNLRSEMKSKQNFVTKSEFRLQIKRFPRRLFILLRN